MARPLRIQFPGALYHVMARGDRCRRIFRKDDDYRQWLSRLAEACARSNLVIHSYCLMPNHYHLMIETPEANLSQGIRHLNSTYSQFFNRRYQLVGHVFQGRFKAILVQKESYLLELSRYIVLNPVRAKLVEKAEMWRWSSMGYMLGLIDTPPWFERNFTIDRFGTEPVRAVGAFRDYVDDGVRCTNPLLGTKHQLILGDEDFVSGHMRTLAPGDLESVTKVHRRVGALSLVQYADTYPSRDEAMARAYLSTAFSMREIGAHFGVRPTTVSRAIRSFKAQSDISN